MDWPGNVKRRVGMGHRTTTKTTKGMAQSTKRQRGWILDFRMQISDLKAQYLPIRSIYLNLQSSIYNLQSVWGITPPTK
jgi:hypothetical protein